MAILDRATLEYLGCQAVNAAGAKGKVAFEKLDGYGFRHSLGVIKSDGTFEEKPIPAPPRHYELRAVSDLLPLCRHVKDCLSATPVIWIGDDGVCITFHDNDESKRWADSAVLNFVKTDQYRLLSTGISQQSQKDFLRLLRQKFSTALGETATTLLPALKQISFKNGVSGKSNVGQGRESMGREIEQEVLSASGDIPETVVLSIALYKDPSLSILVRIVCDLEVDATNQTFALTPLSGELDNAVLRVREHLVSLLGNEVPYFIGSPG